MIILEEAAYVDNELFYKVVLPLIEVDATSLVAISTPRDDDDGSYFSDIVKILGEDNKLIFNVQRIQGSCDKCAEELENPLDCPHVRMIIPPHKSAAKQRIVMALYGDQKDVMARESLGVATSGSGGKFNKRVVDAFFASARIPIQKCKCPVYVAITPNYGALGYTIVSGCYVDDRLVIIGMAMKQVTNYTDMLIFVNGHLEAIRERFEETSQNLRIVIIPESSLGHEAEKIVAATINMEHVQCCRETDKGSKWGVPMHDTAVLADTLDEMLGPLPVPKAADDESTEPDVNAQCNIAFVDKIVSPAPAVCMREMQKQMKLFKAVCRSTLENRKLAYSGRVDGDGKIRPHLRDDLCMTLQLLVFWSVAIRQKRLHSVNYTSLFSCEYDMN